MKVQKIDNNSTFKKLLIKNPQDMPAIVYSNVVKNQGIRDLAKIMDKKGSDLILEYQKGDSVFQNPPKICFLNAKQFYNKYFNYDDKKYSDKYNKIFSIKSLKSLLPDSLLMELHLFDPYDIKEEVHRDVCDYFANIFAERKIDKFTQESDTFNKTLNKPDKQEKNSFLKRLFK